MSTESNKRLVARYYEEIVNTGNVEAIEQFISSDYEEVRSSMCAVSVRPTLT